MTLQQLFDYIQQNPQHFVYFLLGVPIVSLIIGWISEPNSYKEPWNYLYTVLLYAACLPGIFAVTLNVYLFFFERGSILNAELVSRFLPILTMIATLIIIRRFSSFEAIPGFEKLSGLMLIIGILLSMMWILDRTRIYAFTYMPFYYIILIIVGGVYLVRYTLKRMMK